MSIRDNGPRAIKKFIWDARFNFGVDNPAKAAAVDSEWAISVRFV